MGGMCRSIKPLRPPYNEAVTDEDIRAAATQYISKISGFPRPSQHNAAAFERAVAAVHAASTELLATIQVRGGTRQPAASA